MNETSPEQDPATTPATSSPEAAAEAPPASPTEGPNEDESVKEKLDKAGKAAKGFWGVLKAIVRPLLPKKWTPRNIGITVIVVTLLLVALWFLLRTLMWVLPWLIVIGLGGAGLFLLFGPRK